MNGTQIFDTLLSNRKVTLVTDKKSQANSLRVSITRKFKDYRTQMRSLGFLDSDLEDAVVSLEWDEESRTARFFLRPNSRGTVTYTILEEPDDC